MDNLSLMTGLSKKLDVDPGHLTFGAFFEYGNGSYDTYNAFSNAASVNGNGDMRYLGGGILGRFEFARAAHKAARTAAAPQGSEPETTLSGEAIANAAQEARSSGFYVEASGRAGGTHNEYDSADLRDASGRKAEYTSSSPYYGLHIGTGYVWNLSEAASLDLYGKYFWSRQEGDSLTLPTNDPVHFAATDSSRLRFGARFAYAVHEAVQPYLGAAYEHEFDGVARASTYGIDIAAPSLRGGSGIGEIGLRLTPSPSLPLSFDLGVQGYVGKREGVTGSLQARLEF
jgi:outer membrane autotransporter protein